MLCFLAVFVCVEVLRPSQPNGIMSSAVLLPNHTFTGEALRKTLTSGVGLDDMSLAWPAVVQPLVFIYSGIQ